MTRPPLEIDLVEGDHSDAPQKEFFENWSRRYFPDLALTRNSEMAEVHWRLFLRRDHELLSHVAVSEMEIELDGTPILAGAIGALLTAQHLQKNGFASMLMDEAEDFIFSNLNFPLAILFCLEDLVPFYARRNWCLATRPVTLQQKETVLTWGAAVMLLHRDRVDRSALSIHVPSQSGKRNEGAREGSAE